VRTWRERGEGDLFTDPDRLVITADPAGSGANAANAQKGDPCCAYVWDRAANEQVAELHGWMEPDEFAEHLWLLGQQYRFPLLVVEGGPWGGHIISELRHREYPRIYFREQFGDQRVTMPTNWGQYGWSTTGKTKPQMVDALRVMWNEKKIAVNSKACCEEHLTFVRNGTKREAQKGSHDDRVMACAIYAAWAMEHPYTPPAPRTAKPPQTMGEIMQAMLDAERSSKGSWSFY
jgi:hypothetical protein